MKLIFIRHGEPNYEIDSLTEKGWREAELLSKRTVKWNVTDFYCSPLGRAKDTASFTLKMRAARPKFFRGRGSLMRLSLIRRPESAGFRGIFFRMCSMQTGISMTIISGRKSDLADRKHGRELSFCDRRTRCTACALRLCTRRLPLSRFG
ncbi:MAG: histidine phosphatase family protein [Streptococcus sp.]